MASAVFNKLNSSMRKHTFKFQDTYQTKGGPEIQQNTRSQREVSIGSNRAANQAVYQAFNISTISYRVVIISRHQQANFKFQPKSLKHASWAQQTTLKSATENYRSRNNVYPPLKPATFLFFGREPNTQQTAVRMNLTIAANAYPFKLNSNAVNNI